MYAVVKAGGTQHKVGVGDTFTINRLSGEAGDTLTLPALLLVDGDAVTTDAQALAGVTVTGQIVGHGKGPKIRIHKFKNKTGYHKRQGHRQPLTDVLVTGIDTAAAKPAKTAAPAAATPAATAETTEA